jgi:nicotinamide-nucleotide adenylyltransferase
MIRERPEPVKPCHLWGPLQDYIMRRMRSSRGRSAGTKLKRGLFLGRFQPYHNGHHAVIEKIAKEVDELIIGIGSAQWSHSFDNPFTAGERVLMVRRAIRHLPIVTYVLPIEDIQRNSLYVAHIRTICPPFEVVYSNNPLIRRLFEEEGIEVRRTEMIERDLYWGVEIRRRMVNGEPWEELVPPEVVEVIHEIGGLERLRQVTETDTTVSQPQDLRERGSA